MSLSKEQISKLKSDPKKFVKDLSNKELVTILKSLSHLYYNVGESPVSDKVFDYIQDTLKKKDPKNSYFKLIGSKVAKQEEVKLPYFMGSLDKVKPDMESTLTRWLKTYHGPYLLTDKLDGISAMLYRNAKDKKLQLFKRGDGSTGTDISHMVKYLFSEEQISKFPKEFAIRGELILSKKNYSKYGKQFKNARNGVAGITNSKTLDDDWKQITRKIDFVGYTVLYPFVKPEEGLKLIEKYGLPSVVHKVTKKIDMENLKSYLKDRMEKTEYGIDGIVVEDNKIYPLPTNKNPKNAFAFKAFDETAKTQVLEIEWNATKDGALAPTLILKPVELDEVTVKRATAKNAKYVVENKLGPGAEIEIIRSGKVIPEIVKVLKPAKQVIMPKGKYHWDETKTNIFVSDKDPLYKKDIEIKRFVTFFKKLNVKHISEGILTKIYNNGYTKLREVLKAKVSDLAKIDGLGQKSAEKIMKNLTEAFKVVSMPDLLTATNAFGRGLGSKKLKVILDKYPDILATKLSDEKIIDSVMKLNGFQEKTAKKFVSGLKEFKKFYDEQLKGFVDLKHKVIKKKIQAKGKLSGEIILFTGMRAKDDLLQMISNQGGEISLTYSGKVTIVVAKDLSKMSAKLKKAEKDGKKIMDESEFIKFASQAGGNDSDSDNDSSESDSESDSESENESDSDSD